MLEEEGGREKMFSSGVIFHCDGGGGGRQKMFSSGVISDCDGGGGGIQEMFFFLF